MPVSEYQVIPTEVGWFKLLYHDLNDAGAADAYACIGFDSYLRVVHEFARYFNRPPDQLGPDHIRQYQAYLFRERKLKPNTVIQHLGGIRFFYIETLKQS